MGISLGEYTLSRKPARALRTTTSLKSAFLSRKGNPEHFKAFESGEKDLPNVDLRMFDISSKDFAGFNLSKGDFRECNISGTNFRGADLTDSDFRGVDFDELPNFEGARLRGVTLDRHLASVLVDKYDFSPLALRELKIVDPIVDLQRAFFGYKQWIHLIAVLAFVAPYLAFLFAHWFTSLRVDPAVADTISLWTALLRYGFNGGTRVHEGFFFHWSFLVTLFTLAYITARSVLLWKAKELEIFERTTLIPSSFSLSGAWVYLFQFARIGFWINLALVALHTYHFLNTSVVPVESLIRN